MHEAAHFRPLPVGALARDGQVQQQAAEADGDPGAGAGELPPRTPQATAQLQHKAHVRLGDSVIDLLWVTADTSILASIAASSIWMLLATGCDLEVPACSMPGAHPGSGGGGGGTSRGLIAALVGLTGSLPSSDTGLRLSLAALLLTSGEKLCAPVHHVTTLVSMLMTAVCLLLSVHEKWLCSSCADSQHADNAVEHQQACRRAASQVTLPIDRQAREAAGAAAAAVHCGEIGRRLLRVHADPRARCCSALLKAAPTADVSTDSHAARAGLRW